jgi:sugar phosphate isomerase/epimerase
VTDLRFGMSTHLFHDTRLVREHIDAIARRGFGAIELFATRSHFDYRDGEAVGQLATWLQECQLVLHSIHAPIFDDRRDGQRDLLSIASADQRRRVAAVESVVAATRVATRLPFRFLVVHLGVTSTAGGDDNRPDAARQSLEEIVGEASSLGVRVAVEIIPNRLSDAATLVQMIEDGLDGLDVGICLDYGHAHMMGDLGDTIETISGHLWTTHIHDNRGQRDEHLAPFAGTIDWEAAMMATLKIGYDGLLMFEVAGGHDPEGVLESSSRARRRLEQSLVTF